jgi:hypothetical protein
MSITLENATCKNFLYSFSPCLICSNQPSRSEEPALSEVEWGEATDLTALAVACFYFSRF